MVVRTKRIEREFDIKSDGERKGSESECEKERSCLNEGLVPLSARSNYARPTEASNYKLKYSLHNTASTEYDNLNENSSIPCMHHLVKLDAVFEAVVRSSTHPVRRSMQ